MHTVTHVATAAHNEANPTTSCTLTIDAGTVTGDDVIVQCTSRGAAVCTCTDNDSGGNTYTMYAQDAANRLQFFRKKATAGTAGKTITVSGAVTSVDGLVSTYRGGAAGDPITNYTIDVNASGDVTHTPGIMPDSPGSMICFTVFNQSSNNLATAMVAINPSALTSRGTASSTPSAGTDSAVSHGSALQTLAGGPQFTGEVNWTQLNNGTKSLLFAIRPEPTMWISGDRVKETTTTTGTGDLTLGGAVTTSFRAFSAIAANGDALAYVIEHQSAAEWEVGIGIWNTGGTLTRSRVLSSSTGSAVSLSAGTKHVFCSLPAAYGILPVAEKIQAADVVMPENTSLVVTRDYEPSSGHTFEIGLNSALEIG